MVIDTSAILAWLKDEPARDRIVAGLEAHHVRRMSTVSLLEVQIVVRGREHPALLGKLVAVLHILCRSVWHRFIFVAKA